MESRVGPALITVNGYDERVWELVRSGAVTLVKGVPEISRLVGIFNGVWGNSDSILGNIHKKSAIHIWARLNFINQLIQARMVNFAICAALPKCGFPLDGMIEPGRLRVFFPRGYPKLLNKPTSLYSGFVQTGVNKGNPAHRDIHSPHRGEQVNFWFPLSDIHQGQGLIIYSELFGKDVSTNDLGRVTLRHPEMKVPLQVTMEAGDLLVFHSEHLHESPVNNDSTSRLSIDCRCVFFCDDDNRYYHGGFEDITSFLGQKCEPALESALSEYTQARTNRRGRGVKSLAKKFFADVLIGDNSAAFGRMFQRKRLYNVIDDFPPYLLLQWAKSMLQKGQISGAREILEEIVQRYPFSNDRFHQMIELIHSRDPEFCSQIITRVLEETQKPYWLIKLGDFLSKEEDYTNAKRAYLHVVALKNVAEELDRKYSYVGVSCATRFQYCQTANRHYVCAAAAKLKMLEEYGFV